MREILRRVLVATNMQCSFLKFMSFIRYLAMICRLHAIIGISYGQDTIHFSWTFCRTDRLSTELNPILAIVLFAFVNCGDMKCFSQCFEECSLLLNYGCQNQQRRRGWGLNSTNPAAATGLGAHFDQPGGGDGLPP